MTISSITVNGVCFPVLFMHDASMTQGAQERHGIKVKTVRVVTHIPVLCGSIYTQDVVMTSFFSADAFDIVAGHIEAPVCLIERKTDVCNMLEAYEYDERGYSNEPKFIHALNGFLGCTATLNLGFYLLSIIVGIRTRAIYNIYFVDKNHLDSSKDEHEPYDSSLDEFLELNQTRVLL